MRRVIAVVILLCSVMISSCGKAKMNNVSVDYGKSEIYSQEEMDSAVELIKKEFSAWDGCKLHSISYRGDEYSKNNVDYCNELEKDAGYDECIVFESSFHSPKDGGDAWNPDEEYAGWDWYLARKSNGSWTLLMWGYA